MYSEECLARADLRRWVRCREEELDAEEAGEGERERRERRGGQRRAEHGEAKVLPAVVVVTGDPRGGAGVRKVRGRDGNPSGEGAVQGWRVGFAT